LTNKQEHQYVNLYVKVWFCFLIVVVVVTVMLFVFEGVSNQPMNLSPRIFVIICFHSRDSRGRDIAVSDMLISEGLAHAQVLVCHDNAEYIKDIFFPVFRHRESNSQSTGNPHQSTSIQQYQ